MGNGVYTAMIELQVLNYVFEQNSISLFTDNGIDASFFTTYKEHYQFLMDYYAQYNHLPSKETFQGKFADRFEWLIVTDPREYLLSKLQENKLYRDVVGAYKDIGKLITDEKTDQAIELMAGLANKFMTQYGSSCVDLVSDVKLRFDEYVDRVNNPNSAYVTTGLKELDDILGGWDLQNESAFICARTGIGKSWFLIFFAMVAARAGMRVGYYSGEMDASLVGYRFDTFFANLPNGSLTHGNENVMERYENYAKTLNSQISGHLYCIEPNDPMFKGSVTVSKLKAFIEKYDLQMLCVDQFSLLEDERKAKALREQSVNISKDLRALQRLKKIPILSAVQLNREDTEENGPSTKNISESDRIGQDATTVLFLEEKSDNLRIIVGKARNAKSGDKLTYAWNRNMGTLTYIPTEKDAKKGADTDVMLDEYVDSKSNSVF